MCYNVSYLTQKQEKYAARYGAADTLGEILKKQAPVYHTNGFEHADLPVILNTEPDKIQLMEWGLVPHWVKDAEQATKLANVCLNTRGEEMFEKPSFRDSAKNKRCLVIIDGFFEHHWIKDKSFPHMIRFKSREPFSLAGLWSTWTNEPNNLVKHTVSIVTGPANPLMQHIHNQPKASEGPRMPVILSKEDESAWLDPALTKEDLRSLIKPYPESELEAFTVNRLNGKAYKGNVPETSQYVRYEEIEPTQQGLF